MNVSSPYDPSTATVRQKQPLDIKSKVKLHNALKDFEAMFVNYMLKSMKSTVMKSEDQGNGFGGDMLDGIFDYEFSRQISRNSNLGLGEIMYKKITGEDWIDPRAEKSKAGVVESRNEIRKPENQTPEQRVVSVKKPATQLDDRIQSLEPIIEKAAAYHGIDTSLVKAVIAAESSGNIKAQSPKNAKGVMQILDSTAADLGVKNVWDPEENIFGGTKYLKRMLDRFQGKIEDTIASYNAGPSAVERYNGIPPYKETQAYVQKVLEYIRHFQEQENKNRETH
jgi:Rod binding domain-containing protein